MSMRQKIERSHELATKFWRKACAVDGIAHPNKFVVFSAAAEPYANAAGRAAILRNLLMRQAAKRVSFRV